MATKLRYPFLHHTFLGHLQQSRLETSVTHRTLDPKFTRKTSVRTLELPRASPGSSPTQPSVNGQVKSV
ncbi:hypothetical protein BDM02DRAFT_3114290 [Thelephora ganbajun]|uniref:Uncharacterized protein n=1 Tax=Thelephora ganbajun TaxID=370292 RepID=A0ACB6ZI85_THEGA|nr:hypothetical protein BDM02DRAFT_3114290 [Thelephora ganbajun]